MPFHRNGPHQDSPAGYCTFHDEEDVLVHHDLQRSGRLEDMPEDDGAGSSDRPAGSLRDPPTYEEALLSLGRAPTVADLGPHEPDSCSSSLVLYREDSNPEEDQNQLMETENPTPAEAPVKEGMGIAAAPENYQPATPRYIRADDDSEDGQDTDEGDVEATYLAPKQPPAPRPSQDGPIVPALLKEKKPPAEDLQGSSGEESMLELIDLGKGEEMPTPSQPKRADCPHHAEVKKWQQHQRSCQPSPSLLSRITSRPFQLQPLKPVQKKCQRSR